VKKEKVYCVNCKHCEFNEGCYIPVLMISTSSRYLCKVNKMELPSPVMPNYSTECHWFNNNNDCSKYEHKEDK
jgi:hypothetical protein